MSDVSMQPFTFAPTPADSSGQNPVEVRSPGVFNIVFPHKVPGANKGIGRASKVRQGRGTEDLPNQANQGNTSRRPSEKIRHTTSPSDCPLMARSVGILYVGRTEGELAMVLGKVGMSQDSRSVFKRAESFSVSDRIFEFVLEAAYEVNLPKGTVMKRVEDSVLHELEHGGLERYGENFLVPNGHMPFLANRAAEALTRLGHTFMPLDVKEHREEAIERNSKTWDRLRNRQVSHEKDIYQDWLQDHCSPSDSWAGFQQRSQYLRGVYALGYLIRDLATGSPSKCIEIPLPCNGTLSVFPSNSEAAWFEYQAEVDLHLATADSFCARLKSSNQLPDTPHALSVILGEKMDPFDIPNAFLPPTRSNPDLARFRPEHVAALGLIGGRYGEACLWEGLGVRARVPIYLHRTMQKHPDLLPAFRFWIGLKHFGHLHFRLQDFHLPPWAEVLWDDRLLQAARLLEETGFPVPESVQDYVAHAWIPGHRGHFKKPERWVV